MKIWLIIAVMLAMIPAAYAPLWYGTGNDTGLVGRWSCEGNFVDSSGQGNNGTQSGGVQITSGVKGRACYFDGSDDYLTITNSAARSNTITVSAWIKTTASISTRKDFISSGSAATYGSNNWIFSITGNTGVADGLVFFGDTNELKTSTAVITPNTWTHIAYTNNGTYGAIYVNGVLNASGAHTINNNNATGEYIGASNNAGSLPANPLKATIDELRIYNRSLSATEINNLYNTTKTYKIQMYSTPTKGGVNDTPAPETTDTTGLAGWWKLEDNANAESDHGSSGTIMGTTNTTGRWGQAKDFNGVGNSINIANRAATTYTLSFWAKLNENRNQSLAGWCAATSLPCAGASGYTPLVYTLSDGKVTSHHFVASSYLVNTTTSAPVNQWFHIAVATNGTNVTIYYNGNPEGSQVTATSQQRFNTFYLSYNITSVTSINPLNGSLDEVRVYNRTLSPLEIKELYLSKGLVGKWTFDKQDGNTPISVVDKSGYYNNGTVTGATFTNDGRFQEGYQFDGMNDYIDATSSNSFAFNSSATFNAWFKIKGFIPSPYSACIVCQDYPLYGTPLAGMDGLNLLEYAGGIRFHGYNGTHGINSVYAANIATNKWYMATGTYNNTHLCVYLNGVQYNCSTINNFMPDTAGNLRIGTNPTDGGISSYMWLNGTIDEVRLYNRLLSDSEIAALYNGTKSNHIELWTTPVLGGLNDTPAPAASNETGLVGYWKMDDLTNGNTTDSSGQGNNGSVIGAAFNSSGRWNNGYSFDGSNDYIIVNDKASLNVSNVSISVWFKSLGNSELDGRLVSKRNGNVGYELLFTTTTKKLSFLFGNSTTYANAEIGPVLNDTNWHHAVAVNDGVTSTVYADGVAYYSTTVYGSLATPANLYIGRYSPSAIRYFNGSIDEVRIYNRSLSAAEVTELYLSKGLVGYWKMDADQRNATSTFDSSGYYNHGIVSGAALTGEGRFKEAYKFDGVNDFINCSNTSSLALSTSGTVTAWIYDIGISPSAYQLIVDYQDWANTRKGYALWLYNNAGSLVLYGTLANTTGGANSPATPIPDLLNKWHFISHTWNGTDQQIYIDGIYKNSIAAPAPGGYTYPLLIGRSNTIYGAGYSPFNGTIDEVRIYNRALTDTEIGQLYNGTKSNRIQLFSIPG